MTALQFAYPLRHRAHRTEHTPTARFVKEHHDKADDRRCQHKAVEAVGELRNPFVCIRQRSPCVCPVPRKAEPSDYSTDMTDFDQATAQYVVYQSPKLENDFISVYFDNFLTSSY